MRPVRRSRRPTESSGLQRFVEAQDAGGTYERALAELRSGRKTSHWMWFVFPQLAGLGRSAMAQEYAITSLDEARDYLAHPVLGPRLVQCATVMAEPSGHTAEQVLGGIDAVKLRSSMTLFAAAAEPGQDVFADVLARCYDGQPDPATARLLQS